MVSNAVLLLPNKNDASPVSSFIDRSRRFTMAFPNDRGIGPLNWFCPRNSSIPGLLKEPKLAGIEPESRLARRSSRVILIRLEREAGIGPVNRLLDRSSRFNAVSRPRLSGIELESLLLLRSR